MQYGVLKDNNVKLIFAISRYPSPKDRSIDRLKDKFYDEPINLVWENKGSNIVVTENGLNLQIGQLKATEACLGR